MSIIEINSRGISISVSQGFLEIESPKDKQKIAIDSIECIILYSYGAALSNNALIRLCELSIPLIICGRNGMPIGILNSTSGNVYRKTRITAQIAASLPLKKNLWQTVVKAKIANQGLLLKSTGQKYNDFIELGKKVPSGDTLSLEGIAARRYWKRLFGKIFAREPTLPGINSFLNYGYAVIRAAFCRNVAAKGILPELGIHHHNTMNPFCLADDLMEPYRPFIDRIVYSLGLPPEIEGCELTPVYKKRLIEVLNTTVVYEEKKMHLKNCIAITVNKVVNSFTEKKNLLDYPELYVERI